ncbi:MAG: hypothetical protein WEB00_00195 [Dehalococcoidia bacterium]
MPRLLKLDPRPPSYDSLVETLLEPEQSRLVQHDIERADWRPLDPPPGPTLKPVFVDGVQRLEMRVSAEGEGWPISGILASCAAGAIWPGADPALRHVSVERRLILGRGARASVVTVRADNATLQFVPESTKGDDFEELTRALGYARAQMESDVVRRLIADGCELIVVDGRLPEIRGGPVVGLIKTLHDLYVSDPEHVSCLGLLRGGQRSPVFLIERKRGAYYSWFVCLRTPGPLDLGLSGLARLEMEESAGRERAIATADLTARVLPPYASTPERDDRAPQNLLPVGQLERELRHRLGDAELIKRWLRVTFSKEGPDWTP